MVRWKEAAAGLLALALSFASAPSGAAGLSLEFGSPAQQILPVQDGGRGYEGRWFRAFRGGALSAGEVRRALRQKGFRNIDHLDRRGRIYQVQVTDYRGRRFGLVVSAKNGGILATYRIR